MDAGGIQIEVPLADVRCRARVFGDGVPLYVLGGSCGDEQLFALLAWLLREEVRCVLIETPTPVAGSPSDYRTTHVASVLAIAEALQDSTFHLFATGFGVGTALSLAQQFADRVQTLTLQGAGGVQPLSIVEKLLAHLGRWLPGKMRSIPGWRAIQRENHARWFPGYDETRFEFLLQNLGATPIAAVATRRLAGALPLMVDRKPLDLATITQPTVVIHCEGEGPRLEAVLDHLQKQLPQAHPESIPSAGLFPYLTHTHRLVRLLKEHVMHG